MPEVNFAREREKREQELGLNHNLWCAVESPQGGREPGQWPVVKHGGETLECVFIWRNMPRTMPVIVHVLL